MQRNRFPIIALVATCIHATTNMTTASNSTDLSNEMMSYDTPPLCDPVSCRVLLTMGVSAVALAIFLVGWHMYQRYTFRREREQFQLRETEIRSAIEESITSSRSLRSMASSVSVQV